MHHKDRFTVPFLPFNSPSLSRACEHAESTDFTDKTLVFTGQWFLFHWKHIYLPKAKFSVGINQCSSLPQPPNSMCSLYLRLKRDPHICLSLLPYEPCFIVKGNTYLQKFIANMHPSISSCRSIWIDTNYEDAHTRAVLVASKTQSKPIFVFLKLNNVQLSREICISLPDFF